MVFCFFSINITKLDVLDQLAEVRIGVEYRLDGKKLDGFPGEFDGTGSCRVLSSVNDVDRLQPIWTFCRRLKSYMRLFPVGNRTLVKLGALRIFPRTRKTTLCALSS